MDIENAIYNRRSIREFLSKQLTEEQIRKILNAARMAPSAKNRQPWCFFVVKTQEQRELMVEKIIIGIKDLLQLASEDSELRKNLGMAYKSAEIVRSAPLTILVGYNPLNKAQTIEWSETKRLASLTDIESVDMLAIGASIENMALCATGMGVGSLWNCDVLYSYNELNNWIGWNCKLVAAISFGYPEQNKNMFSRKKLSDLIYDNSGKNHIT